MKTIRTTKKRPARTQGVQGMATQEKAPIPGEALARTGKERAASLRAWAESNPRDTPLLSDEALSRESIYAQRGKYDEE